MKLKFFKWFPLILGSLIAASRLFVAVWTYLAFMKGYQIEFNSEFTSQYAFIFIRSLIFILIVVYAWFRNMLGGFLLILASLISVLVLYLIKYKYADHWFQYEGMLMISGGMLLFYVYYNKWLLRRG